MSHTLSVHDAKHAMDPRSPRRSRDLNSSHPERATRRRRKLQALIEVPMLPWPAHLFNDNATMAELLIEDSPMRWRLPASLLEHQDPENYIRAAA